MQFQASKEDTTRYLPFVRRIAEKIKRQFNPPLEIDELVSCGYQGLHEALQRFDPSWNVKFETFAYYRIRGSMFEGISRQCPLSRHMAKKLRLARKGNDYMETAAGDAAGAQNKSGEAKAAMAADIIRDLASIHTMVSVTYRRGERDGEFQPEFVDEAAALKPEEAVTRNEMRELLKELEGDQAELIRLYYFEDLTLEDAGKRLGFTKGWACKLHHAAIRKLRRLMERRDK